MSAMAERFVGYRCPRDGCNAWSENNDTALDHCRCARRGCGNEVKLHYAECDDHLSEVRREKAERRRARELADMTWVSVDDLPEDQRDMFYCSNDDTWHHSLEDLYEHCEYMEIPAEDVCAHPGIRSTVSSPDLTEVIAENWGEQYGDDSWDGITDTTLLELLELVQTFVNKRAPVVYTGDTRKRIEP